MEITHIQGQIIPVKTIYGGKKMIKLTKYQLAENEIRMLFFQYNELSVEELKNSNLISDIDAYLRKWCHKIPVLGNIKKDMREEISAIKEKKGTNSEDIISIYVKYLNGLNNQMAAISVLIMNERITRISSQIEKGIESYYYNHYY